MKELEHEENAYTKAVNNKYNRGETLF